ncbi:hypothetical protein HSR121_0900 [Halapricum desulfuricans]|uniref:Uncharacterized protein n=1 Tax=Halapricum desulfuricans TaxID=2841257 RepID=A0A897MSY8_9EURY|nr:hypothetical protein HSR121_0900 [Halapricum desulfuricans]
MRTSNSTARRTVVSENGFIDRFSVVRVGPSGSKTTDEWRQRQSFP